eukprot:TRINITY_DN21446_c0_g1_i1.p1 TRINITY_DN21446_c0_g1~~TRINITY_DN21446_c0_g1_i1.p1  ORF type:complete len:341 (-),score=76.95 TRINITY_DN21446_c0_g1_i1:59-1081(-)
MIAQRESTMKELLTAVQREKDLGGVRCLKLATCVCEDLVLDAFQTHASSLTTVSLKWCPLSLPLAQKWAEFLRTNTTLTSLTLNVGREGGTDTDTCGMLLAESLLRNTRIMTVKLRANDFHEKTALQFGRILAQNNTLTHLDLSSNRIGGETEALGSIFRGLKASFLKTLVLRDISLKGEETSVILLADSLKENKYLTRLDLFANSLGPTGCGLLANALKFNNVLRYLDLYGNSAGDAGAEEIGRMLKLNKALEELSLQCNGISETGMKEIAEGLAGNFTLKALNLAANCLGKSEVEMKKMLLFNTTLQRLDLRYTDAKRMHFNEILQTRKTPLNIVWLF